MLTYKFRVKDGSSGTRNELLRQARAVNSVWNYCCEIQRQAMKWGRRWPSYFDLTKLTSGTSKELGLHCETIMAVCSAFATARDTERKCPRWRGEKSLPWVPFNHADRIVAFNSGGVVFRRRKYRLWKHREISGSMRIGTFGCDARGRWYFNVVCDVEDKPILNRGMVGIDLGLKSFAVLSDGTEIKSPRFSKKYEQRLAIAQRAGNKKRAAAIHAKIANSRKDFLHNLSNKLVRQYATIVVGDVSASNLKQANMGKSVSDASWYAFKTMLAYKATRHRVRFIEANERMTSQTCSDCGAISGPKGRKGLAVRSWECAECGAVHDRDHNAAKNILRVGAECRPPLAEIAA